MEPSDLWSYGEEQNIFLVQKIEPQFLGSAECNLVPIPMKYPASRVGTDIEVKYKECNKTDGYVNCV